MVPVKCAMEQVQSPRAMSTLLVRKCLEEIERFRLVSLDAVSRRLTGPTDDGVGLVALCKSLKILRIPGVIQRLHEFHEVLGIGHGCDFLLGGALGRIPL